ncbi:MAG: hypothetical protein AAFX40_17925 [Cyanobacteria bacterium J06639_1]
MKNAATINCAEACANGCVLGDRCPHREYAQAATQFIDSTPLDRLHEISAERFLPKDGERAIAPEDAPQA